MAVTPYYEHGCITIYHGDCRDVLPTLGEVDLLLTDPPYGIGYRTSRRSCNHKLSQPIANDANLDVVRECWPLATARLRDDRHWYAFATLKPSVLRASVSIFGDAKQMLIWDKGDRGTVGDLKAGFAECCEAVFYGHKGRRPINGSRPRSVIRFDWSGAMDPVHPTVKPVHLLRRFINWSSRDGEVVLDPFMGSGTTLRAAKDCGRRAIGIEVEEEYCEAAVRRLQQEVLPL